MMNSDESPASGNDVALDDSSSQYLERSDGTETGTFNGPSGGGLDPSTDSTKLSWRTFSDSEDRHESDQSTPAPLPRQRYSDEANMDSRDQSPDSILDPYMPQPDADGSFNDSAKGSFASMGESNRPIDEDGVETLLDDEENDTDNMHNERQKIEGDESNHPGVKENSESIVTDPDTATDKIESNTKHTSDILETKDNDNLNNLTLELTDYEFFKEPGLENKYGTHGTTDSEDVLKRAEAFDVNTLPDVSKGSDMGARKERSRLEELERDNFQLKLRVVMLEQYSSSNADIGEMRKRLVDSEAERLSLRRDNEKLRETIAELNSSNDYDRATTNTREKDAIIQEYEARLEEIEEDYYRLKSMCTELETETAKYRDQYESEQKEKAEYEQALNEAEEINEELIQKNAALKKQLSSTRNSPQGFSLGSEFRDRPVNDAADVSKIHSQAVQLKRTLGQSARFSRPQRSPGSISLTDCITVLSEVQTIANDFMSDFSHMKEAYDRLEYDLQKSEAEKNDLNYALAEREDDVFNLQSQLDSLEGASSKIHEIYDLLDEVKDLRRQNDLLADQVETRDSELVNIRLSHNDIEIELDNCRRELKLREERNGERIAELRTSLDKTLKDQRSTVSQLQTRTTELVELQSNLSAYKTKLEELSNSEMKLEEIVAVLKACYKEDVNSTSVVRELREAMSKLAEAASSDAKLSASRLENEKLKADLSKKELEIAALRESLESKLANAKDELESLKKKSAMDISLLESQADLLRTSETKLQSRVEILTKEKEQLNANGLESDSRLTQSLELYKKHLTEAHLEQEKLSKRLEEEMANARKLKAQMDERDSEIEALKDELQSLTSNRQKMHTYSTELEAKVTELSSVVTKESQKAQEYTQENRKLKEQLFFEKSKSKDLSHNVELISASLKKRRQAEKSEVEELRNAKTSSEATIVTLESKLRDSREKIFSFLLAFVKQMGHILGSQWTMQTLSDLENARKLKGNDSDDSVLDVFDNLDKIIVEISAGVMKAIQRVSSDMQKRFNQIQQHDSSQVVPTGDASHRALSEKDKWLLDVLSGKNLHSKCPDCGSTICSLRLHEMKRKYEKIYAEAQEYSKKCHDLIHEKDDMIYSLRRQIHRLKSETDRKSKRISLLENGPNEDN